MTGNASSPHRTRLTSFSRTACAARTPNASAHAESACIDSARDRPAPSMFAHGHPGAIVVGETNMTAPTGISTSACPTNIAFSHPGQRRVRGGSPPGVMSCLRSIHSSCIG